MDSWILQQQREAYSMGLHKLKINFYQNTRVTLMKCVLGPSQ